MSRQKSEHVDIPVTLDFLSDLGEDELAVVGVAGDVARDRFPLAVRECAIEHVARDEVAGPVEHRNGLSVNSSANEKSHPDGWFFVSAFALYF